MRTFEIQEFASGVLCDNALLAQSVAHGDQVSLSEIVELAAGARSLYNLSTLLSRELDRTEDCSKVWISTSRQFEALCRAWAEVPQDGEVVSWHRAQLEHLRQLTADRVELYSVTEADRREYQELKRDEDNLETAFSERGD